MANVSTRTPKFLIGALTACMWTVLSVAPVEAVPIARGLSEFTAMFEKAEPPKGWHAFCARYASECEGETSTPRKITLTPENWEAIVGANDWVNRHIKPMMDRKHWGTINKWVYPDDGIGDCKAYTLLKRRILMEVGFPREALLVTIVWTKENQGHAVLIARTDKGDFVLDNLTHKVLLWTQTTHDYVERQSPTNPNSWVYIDGYRQNKPVAVAGRDN